MLLVIQGGRMRNIRWYCEWRQRAVERNSQQDVATLVWLLYYAPSCPIAANTTAKKSLMPASVQVSFACSPHHFTNRFPSSCSIEQRHIMCRSYYFTCRHICQIRFFLLPRGVNNQGNTLPPKGVAFLVKISDGLLFFGINVIVAAGTLNRGTILISFLLSRCSAFLA